jgi:hypothetical protein
MLTYPALFFSSWYYYFYYIVSWGLVACYILILDRNGGVRFPSAKIVRLEAQEFLSIS